MIPAYFDPIVPVLPDFGPALAWLVAWIALAVLAGMAAVLHLTLRSARRARSGPSRTAAVLDAVARSVVDGAGHRVDPAGCRSSSR